jgi:hypothetical protein
MFRPSQKRIVPRRTKAMNRNCKPPLQPRAAETKNAYRAPLADRDDGLTWPEGALFLLLIGAVGLAFVSHARVAHGFVNRLPEFATIVADLFRHAV